MKVLDRIKQWWSKHEIACLLIILIFLSWMCGYSSGRLAERWVNKEDRTYRIEIQCQELTDEQIQMLANVSKLEVYND